MKKQILKYQSSLSAQMWKTLNAEKFDLNELVEINNQKNENRRRLKALELITLNK